MFLFPGIVFVSCLIWVLRFGDIAKFYISYVNVLFPYSNILLFTANAFWMGTFCKWPPTCPFSRMGVVMCLGCQHS